MSIIYHYTNQSGLTGILSSNTTSDINHINLWFTRADCLNDSSEGSDIMRVYETVLQEMKDSMGISEKQYQALQSVDFNAPAVFICESKEDRHSFLPQIVESDVFICSFSRSEDELDLWRYYSKGSDGYCIGFRKEALESALNDYQTDSSPLYKVSWHRVVYSDETKMSQIKAVIENNLSFFKQDDKQSLLSLTRATQRDLCLMKYSFKHNCFKSEREVRCIISVPKKKIEGINNPQVPIKERLGCGKIIPYINWECDAVALFSVLVSPMASDGAEAAAQEYVDRFLGDAYRKVKVIKSQLPARF